MRYAASEKLEIIRLVEQSHLPVRKTLEKLGVSRATFYIYGRLSRLQADFERTAWPVANIYPASPEKLGSAQMGNPLAHASIGGCPSSDELRHIGA
jgi:hypothetical protein